MKSSANYNFSQVPAPQIQRSVFDRTTPWKGTFDSSYLIPFLVDEILPGDTVNLRATLFARISTLIYPIMDNVHLDTFFFFIPNRLVWANWERFNGAQDNPDDSTDFEVPILDLTEDDPPVEFAENSLFDYFGLPTNTPLGYTVGLDWTTPNIQALPFRAYYLTWNEWFRDENLQDSLTVETDDGPDQVGAYTLQKRGKRHDYFTSALPWPQKGDSVMLPLGTSAPVIGTGFSMGFYNTASEFAPVSVNGDSTMHWQTSAVGDAVGTAAAAGSPAGNLVAGLSLDPAKSGIIADLSAATAATVNQLRQAFAFQKILERDARGGTRYVELLKAHFGVTSPDFRLQRPEYLGGSTQRVGVREVPQTSASPATPTEKNVQGGLSAYGTVGAQTGFSKSFVEHGLILGLVNVRSDMTYQNNIRRMWSRRTRFDYYLPALAHLGEQTVLNQELFWDPTGTGDQLPSAAFGYQERWAEYRYFPGTVTGAFRSNAAQSLDAWHLAYDFAAIPPLNAAFIVDAPPIDRVIAVPGTTEVPMPQVLLDALISIRHARPMPVFSTPGQLDRF